MASGLHYCLAEGDTKMNGKRFWTVSMVAVALTLFSSFVFGQVLSTGMDFRSKTTVMTQLDLLAQTAGLLEDTITFEVESGYTPSDSDPGLRAEFPRAVCDDKMQLYGSALSYVGMAWDHISNAQAALNSYETTGDKSSLYLYYAEVGAAWTALSQANDFVQTARNYECPELK
jgi:hypothetical protein